MGGTGPCGRAAVCPQLGRPGWRCRGGSGTASFWGTPGHGGLRSVQRVGAEERVLHGETPMNWLLLGLVLHLPDLYPSAGRVSPPTPSGPSEPCWVCAVWLLSALLPKQPCSSTARHHPRCAVRETEAWSGPTCSGSTSPCQSKPCTVWGERRRSGGWRYPPRHTLSMREGVLPNVIWSPALCHHSNTAR